MKFIAYQTFLILTMLQSLNLISIGLCLIKENLHQTAVALKLKMKVTYQGIYQNITSIRTKQLLHKMFDPDGNLCQKMEIISMFSNQQRLVKRRLNHQSLQASGKIISADSRRKILNHSKNKIKTFLYFTLDIILLFFTTLEFFLTSNPEKENFIENQKNK